MWADALDGRYRAVRRGLAALIGLRLAVGSYAGLADQPDAQLEPPGFLAWMTSVPPAAFLVVVQVLGVVAALAAASGWGVRRPAPSVARMVAAVAYPVAWLTYLYLAGVKTSGGKILHNDVLILLVAFPLVFVSENPVPARRRRNVGWPLNLSLLILVLAYFLAGVAKLVHSGPEWVFSENVRYVMYWAAQTDGTPKGMAWLAEIPGNHAWIAQVIAATTIVFECGAPAILFWRRLRPWYALLAVTLHVGTWATIGLDYWGWSLAVLVVLVDWTQVEPRRTIPGSGAVAGSDDARRDVVATLGGGTATEGLLVYDGDCAFCTRTAGWVERRADGRAVVRPWHGLDLAALGLSEDQVAKEVWWVAADGSAHAGYRAVALALWATGGWGIPAGRALLVPGVGVLAGPVYRLVARNRHQMPGGTDACRIDDGPRPSSPPASSDL